MDKFIINIMFEDKKFYCNENESISSAMKKIDSNHSIVGCCNGGCGVCKIKILKGEYSVGRVSRKHLSDYELGKGYTLACRTFPKSDMKIMYVGRDQQKY